MGGAEQETPGLPTAQPEDSRPLVLAAPGRQSEPRIPSFPRSCPPLPSYFSPGSTLLKRCKSRASSKDRVALGSRAARNPTVAGAGPGAWARRGGERVLLCREETPHFSPICTVPQCCHRSQSLPIDLTDTFQSLCIITVKRAT